MRVPQFGLDHRALIRAPSDRHGRRDRQPGGRGLIQYPTVRAEPFDKLKTSVARVAGGVEAQPLAIDPSPVQVNRYVNRYFKRDGSNFNDLKKI